MDDYSIEQIVRYATLALWVVVLLLLLLSLLLTVEYQSGGRKVTDKRGEGGHTLWHSQLPFLLTFTLSHTHGHRDRTKDNQHDNDFNDCLRFFSVVNDKENSNDDANWNERDLFIVWKDSMKWAMTTMIDHISCSSISRSFVVRGENSWIGLFSKLEKWTENMGHWMIWMWVLTFNMVVVRVSKLIIFKLSRSSGHGIYYSIFDNLIRP